MRLVSRLPHQARRSWRWKWFSGVAAVNSLTAVLRSLRWTGVDVGVKGRVVNVVGMADHDRTVVVGEPVSAESGVTMAVEAARHAAVWWAARGHAERRRRLMSWKRYIVAHMDDLAAVMVRETGKPLADSLLEITLGVEHLDWAARNARWVLRPRRLSSGKSMINISSRQEYLPLGVVGVIGPWNYPVFTPLSSIGQALAAGNAVVFKPSEHTLGVGGWLADAFAAVNGEHPVLRVVTGGGAVGAALCRAGVDKIAFTGSTATARRVMAACAETLTPVLIEAGGKDAMVVAADADVDEAAAAAVWGGMVNAGQTCIGVERVYVVDSVYPEFLRRVTEMASGLRLGEHYGPMTVPGQLDVVRRHVSDAVNAGGRAVLGGVESVRPPWVHPVVLTDVPETCSALTEETFGPVIVVNRVADVDEAVRRANDSSYGLGSAVFTRDRRAALAIARRLRTGGTAINSVITFATVPALPFGGVGGSGFGRVHGDAGLKEFSLSKGITRQLFRSPLNLTTFDRTSRDVSIAMRLVRLLHGR